MAKEVGSLNPDQMRLVWQTTQKLLQSGLLHDRRPARQVPLETFRVWVKNDDIQFDEEIPPYACMEVKGAEFYEGRLCVTVQKPRNKCGHYLFNSEHEIEKRSQGGAGWAYAHGIVRMRGSGGFSGCQRYAPTPFTWDVESGPGPFVCYGSDTNDDGQDPALWGRIIGDYCRARYILIDYTATGDSAGSQITEFWEGNDPRECGEVSIVWPLGQPQCDTKVVAIYDSNSGEYKAITSPSAMLGDPKVQQIVRDVGAAECGISVGKTSYFTFPADDECEGEVQFTPVELGSEIPVVIAIASDACGQISYAYQNINAFLCGGGPQFTSLPINFDGVSFVSDIEWGPPVCDGTAIYTWNASIGQWQLTQECSAGCAAPPPPEADGTEDGETDEVACIEGPGQTNCGLRLTMSTICQAEGTGGGGTIRSVPISLAEQVVLTGATLTEEEGLTFTKATVYVCGVGPADDKVIEVYECPPEASGEETGTGSGV